MLLSSLIVVLPLIPPPPLSLSESLATLLCRFLCSSLTPLEPPSRWSVGRRAPSAVVAVGLAASEVAVLYYSLHPSLAPSLPLSLVRGVCS